MSSDDCEKIELPAWGQEIHETIKGTEDGSKPVMIASLLLAKLGDYLTPGQFDLLFCKINNELCCCKCYTIVLTCHRSSDVVSSMEVVQFNLLMKSFTSLNMPDKI